MDLVTLQQWRTEQIQKTNLPLNGCYWKGDLVRDEHGIVMKRRNACCGGRVEVVDRYVCHHPRIEEGETSCELRCHYAWKSIQ